jgi:hypothetical protein
LRGVLDVEEFTLERLADFICGDDSSFAPIRRSSMYLTRFFEGVELPRFKHDGSTRKWWVLDCLKKCSDEELKQVILGLASPEIYGNLDHLKLALKSLNEVLNPKGFMVEINGVKPVLNKIEPRLPWTLNIPSNTYIQKDNQIMIKIFISHSSKDIELVLKLVDLFRAALNLTSQEIRCTSLAGFRLPGGADVNEQLRQEIHESEVFVAVISQSSLKSQFVFFELGARWGTDKHLIPLLAQDTDISAIQEPLASLNILRCNQFDQLYQLVQDIASFLHIACEPPQVYNRFIKEIIDTIQPPNAEYKTDWVHNYPASYSGIIWEKVEIQPTNKNKTHRYTIKWGKWQYTGEFQGQDVVYLWHRKGNDGQSIEILFHIEPASKVTFEKGDQPPIGAIDINDGWTEQ